MLRVNRGFLAKFKTTEEVKITGSFNEGEERNASQITVHWFFLRMGLAADQSEYPYYIVLMAECFQWAHEHQNWIMY